LVRFEDLSDQVLFLGALGVELALGLAQYFVLRQTVVAIEQAFVGLAELLEDGLVIEYFVVFR
jgi:hypothetical protein